MFCQDTRDEENKCTKEAEEYTDAAGGSAVSSSRQTRSPTPPPGTPPSHATGARPRTINNPSRKKSRNKRGKPKKIPPMFDESITKYVIISAQELATVFGGKGNRIRQYENIYDVTINIQNNYDETCTISIFGNRTDTMEFETVLNTLIEDIRAASPILLREIPTTENEAEVPDNADVYQADLLVPTFDVPTTSSSEPLQPRYDSPKFDLLTNYDLNDIDLSSVKSSDNELNYSKSTTDSTGVNILDLAHLFEQQTTEFESDSDSIYQSIPESSLDSDRGIEDCRDSPECFIRYLYKQKQPTKHAYCNGPSRSAAVNAEILYSFLSRNLLAHNLSSSNHSNSHYVIRNVSRDRSLQLLDKACASASHCTGIVNDSTPPSPPVLYDWELPAIFTEEDRLKIIPKNGNCEAFIKNVSKENNEMTKVLSPDEAVQWREVNYVTIKSLPTYAQIAPLYPINAFQVALPWPMLIELLHVAGFYHPTVFQAQALPYTLNDNNFVGVSDTGSGKRLAYILPAFLHVVTQRVIGKAHHGGYVIVMTASNEYTERVVEDIRRIFDDINIFCVNYDRVRSNSNVISSAIDIIIGEVTQLKKMILSKMINPSYVSLVIMDRLDEIINLRLQQELKFCMRMFHADRKILITANKWIVGVRGISVQYATNAVLFQEERPIRRNSARKVTHKVIVTSDYDKDKFIFVILFLIRCNEKVLIFCKNKYWRSHIISELAINGIPCRKMRNDCDETWISGECNVAVAINYLHEAVDPGEFSHIINVDFPLNIEEYVYRESLIGNNGNESLYLTLFSETSDTHVHQLVQVLRSRGQMVPPELKERARR